MNQSKTLFPHKLLGFALAASDAPVLLNGMRVIFDEKVALYPVQLESQRPNETPNDKSGNKGYDNQ